MLERVAKAIGYFRQRRQAVQIELISAMPAELERRLLQDQLHLAIGYFSGHQQALDYQPLFDEQQRLYCAKGHPLFGVKNPSPARLEACDGVHHPYRFSVPAEPFLPAISTARTEQIEGTLTFILSGAHIGYLPRHIAAPWQARGVLQPLGPETLGFNVQFHLTNHRGREPGEAQLALVEDLKRAFTHQPDA